MKGGSNHILYYFYFDECPYCQEFSPMWDELNNELDINDMTLLSLIYNIGMLPILTEAEAQEGDLLKVEHLNYCIDKFSSQIGGECELENGDNGFYDCDLCCWDTILLLWLGDEYCDQFGGCAWEGPQFNCYELSYDCGDCQDFEVVRIR